MELSNEQIKILPKLLSKGIKKSKVLPRQPYIKEELEKKGFKNLPKKDPFFFIDEVSVNIAGDFQKGCLLVHLDGLYSNCVPDSPDDELKLIMPWDSIYDILVNDSKTARAMPDGITELLLLTDDNKNPEEAQCLSIIMKSPSKLNSPFSVIKSIYDNIWKRMIDLYRGKPIIWGSHIDWFTQETFFSRDEFVGFYLEEVYEDDGGDFSKEITDKMQDDGYTGKGYSYYVSGAKYVGEYKDGKMHGQGTFTYGAGAGEGETYVGEFSNDVFNGQGTLTLPNGDKHVGEFKDDKRNGQGTYTFANGTIQEGLFENDKYIGKNSEEPKAKEEVCAKGLTTPLAEISYIFLSFAHFTDGEVSKEEREEAITNSMQMAHKWSYTKDEAIAAWAQAAKTHDECETIKDIFSIYIDVLNTLGSREFFDNEEKNELIVRLERIMNVDHVQHENEIMWINKIKEIWKLEEDSSQDSSDEEKSVLEKAMEGITKKDLAEKIVKNIEVSTKNPEAYAFVKAVSAKGAKMLDILDKYELIFDDHINFADEDGYTAMHYACWDNKPIILQMLIDFGANPNVLSPTNETPLNMAVVSGHFDIVQFFVDYDFEMELNIDWENRNKTENPFHSKKGSTLIRDAILNQHWDIFDILIDGIGPNLDVLAEPCSVGVDGETNFFLAIEKLYQKKNIDYDKERLDVLRSVLESSADISGNKKKTTKKKSEVKVSEGEPTKSAIHKFGFLLCSFATTTDNKFSKEEMAKVVEILKSTGADEKIGLEIFDWFNEEMGKVNWKFDDKAFKKVLLDCIQDVGNFLNQFDEKVAMDKKKLFINDLISVANSDGKILDKEIAFIEMLCVVIEIEIPNILDADPERRWGQAKVVEEKEDDNKGYPGIRVRNFKDKEGNKDAKKQKLVSKYMMNWHEPTEEYNGRLGITARIPDFFESINKNCPKWTSDEITNIKNYITKYKVIPTLRYAPEEFTNWTKQVWWLAPFVFVEGPEGEIASWLFIDKNGFYVAHPSDNDSSPIFSWDNITDMDTEWLEDNLVMLTLYSEQNDKDIELRICEFVSEGNGSYLEVIESIHSIYEKTIEESRGSSTWSHGAGGEGYEGFDTPKELLDENKWKAVVHESDYLIADSMTTNTPTTNEQKGGEKEVELKTENKTLSKDASIWEIIQHEFINLDKESVVKKDFSEMILKKYPHIKKGTLGAQISIQVINKRSRTNYAQCSKERFCGDDKFDFLFEQEDKTLCKYDKDKHGVWEIYKRDDGKLDVRIINN